MDTLRLTGECASGHGGPVPAGDVLVRDGRLANAFVYVSDGLGGRTFAVPDAPVTIDQRGCLYAPRVIGAQTCQPIRFVNSDAFLHNVHGSPARSPAWNFGMSVRGSERTIRLEEPEVMVGVRCDVHPWMHAYIGVLDHPYFAVTGPDGRFTLAGVPSGDLVVRAWHERFGARETKVSLGAKETKDLTFTYGGPG
jgi:plastocyanin